MKPLSGAELMRLARNLGWRYLRQEGSHVRFVSADGARHTTIPNHGTRKLAPGTQRTIMRALGLGPADI